LNRARDRLDELREQIREIREHMHGLADKVNVLWGERYLRLQREAKEKKEQENDGEPGAS
jgi:hypothetical protein